MYNLTDRFALDANANIRRTSNGFVVAMPRVARTGIQLYRGSELGRNDMDIVRVYRPEDQVFKKESLATFSGKPVTDDHPPVEVTAKNWKDYAKGQIGEDVLRDQQFIRVPMCLMDQGLIDKFDGGKGKAELSVGYQCDIKWGAGTSPEGEAYDAMQTDIVANHVAVVDAARGGEELRIGDGTGDQRVNMTALANAVSLILKGNIVKDSALADADAGHLGKDGKSYPILKDGLVSIGSLRAAKTNAVLKGDGDIVAALDNLLAIIDPPAPAKPAAMQKDTRAMKTMQLDGITIEVGDGNASEVIAKHIAALQDANAQLTKKAGETQAEYEKRCKEMGDSIAKLTTEAATKDAQIATLTKQLADAAVTPAKLDALVADRKVVADKAKVAMGDKVSSLVIDGKSDHEIRAQVVNSKLGDAAKGWSEDQIKVSFDTLTAGIDLTKAATQADLSQHRPGGYLDTARTFSSAPVVDGNAEAAANARDKRLEDAWKGPTASA